MIYLSYWMCFDNSQRLWIHRLFHLINIKRIWSNLIFTDTNLNFISWWMGNAGLSVIFFMIQAKFLFIFHFAVLSLLFLFTDQSKNSHFRVISAKHNAWLYRYFFSKAKWFMSTTFLMFWIKLIGLNVIKTTFICIFLCEIVADYKPSPNASQA